MTQGSLITDEMKKVIGVESEPSVYEIEKEPIRRWANAIGDTNPLYHDEAYARKHGYKSLIAPPGFIATYAFPVKAVKPRERLAPSLTRGLNGGNEYEFLKPIQAGDTITMTSKIADIFEREGRLGKMLFSITEHTYKNQHGEVVAKARFTSINY